MMVAVIICCTLNRPIRVGKIYSAGCLIGSQDGGEGFRSAELRWSSRYTIPYFRLFVLCTAGKWCEYIEQVVVVIGQLMLAYSKCSLFSAPLCAETKDM